MITRRRLLAISAAAFAVPAGAASATWTGRAMGAEVRITLAGATGAEARPAFREVARLLALTESRWSLHRDSELARLNATGRLARPSPEVLRLFALATRLHSATDGAFDPTVQPLWRALAEGRNPTAARALIGWDRLRISEAEIALAPGMALTFNGLAQGAAADAVAGALTARGFRDVLVDTGEQVGLGERPSGGPWRAAIALPDGTPAGRAQLADTALATSAPAGTLIGGTTPHILDPRTGAPAASWRLVSVLAPSAAVADGLSTAACLMTRPEIDAALFAFPGARLAAIV
jgi:thiamine biosynthesis lipoprotein